MQDCEPSWCSSNRRRIMSEYRCERGAVVSRTCYIKKGTAVTPLDLEPISLPDTQHRGKLPTVTLNSTVLRISFQQNHLCKFRLTSFLLHSLWNWSRLKGADGSSRIRTSPFRLQCFGRLRRVVLNRTDIPVAGLRQWTTVKVRLIELA